MRPRGAASELEGRRRRALALLDSGLSLSAVGRAVGCAASSVMRWRNARRLGGEAALQVRRAPGRSPRLGPEAHSRLGAILAAGARSWGFPDAVWTASRFAEVIERSFGIRYHRDHAGRLLRRLRPAA